MGWKASISVQVPILSLSPAPRASIPTIYLFPALAAAEKPLFLGPLDKRNSPSFSRAGHYYNSQVNKWDQGPAPFDKGQTTTTHTGHYQVCCLIIASRSSGHAGISARTKPEAGWWKIIMIISRVVMGSAVMDVTPPLNTRSDHPRHHHLMMMINFGFCLVALEEFLWGAGARTLGRDVKELSPKFCLLTWSCVTPIMDLAMTSSLNLQYNTFLVKEYKKCSIGQFKGCLGKQDNVLYFLRG